MSSCLVGSHVLAMTLPGPELGHHPHFRLTELQLVQQRFFRETRLYRPFCAQLNPAKVIDVASVPVGWCYDKRVLEGRRP